MPETTNGRDASKRVVKNENKFKRTITKDIALALFDKYMPDTATIRLGISDVNDGGKGVLVAYTDQFGESLGQWPVSNYPNQWRKLVPVLFAALYECIADETSDNPRLSYRRTTKADANQPSLTATSEELDNMLANL